MREENRLVVEKVDHEEGAMRERLLEWLGAHETKALFIVGNLASGYAGSHLYVARRGEKWVGVAGYYERPQSVCPFALDAEASKALVRFIASEQSPIAFINAVAEVGEPCLAAMRELGFEPYNDPRQVFMEASIPAGVLSRVPHEEKARPIEARDAERAAWLMRYLQRPGDASPIDQSEIDRVMMNKWRMVLEVDGRIVSTASTNGVGISAFQILGVATDEKFRGNGYARATCAALIRRMSAEGARRVVLFTGPENEAARRCYARLGFEATGEYCMAKFKVAEV